MAHTENMTGDNQSEAKTILVIEDDADIAEFLGAALTLEMGCHCLFARDGFQAMEHLTTLVPDLLIVDYQLPDINGLELYDRLHEREPLRHIPALFISANLPADELEKRHVHALSKPFAVEVLLQQVKAILMHSKSS